MAYFQRLTKSAYIGGVSLLAVWIGAYAATPGVRRTVTVSEGTNPKFSGPICVSPGRADA